MADGYVPNIPTYREIDTELKRLETEHKLLQGRYDTLCNILKQQGKEHVYTTREGH
jgi:hypothetical protein